MYPVHRKINAKQKIKSGVKRVAKAVDNFFTSIEKRHKAEQDYKRKRNIKLINSQGRSVEKYLKGLE